MRVVIWREALVSFALWRAARAEKRARFWLAVARFVGGR